MASKTVADIEGPWVDPNFDSGLVVRVRRNWHVPIDKLSNEMVATFLRQRIATNEMINEATKRLADCFDDGSELYDGELANALNDARDKTER